MTNIQAGFLYDQLNNLDNILQNKYNFDYREYDCKTMTLFIKKYFIEFPFIRSGIIKLT